MTEEEEDTHESYGMIGINRVNGSPGNLFGSHLAEHGHFVSIEIRQGSRMHDLNYDWYHGGKLLAEVHLSAAQFAEFITTSNIARGVPCTITRMGGNKLEPVPPTQKTEAGRIHDEFEGNIRKWATKVDKQRVDILELLKGTGTLKVADRNTIIKHLNSISMEIEQNIPFAVSSFQESVEKTANHAKAELDAMITRTIHETGVDVLAMQRHKELGDGNPTE